MFEGAKSASCRSKIYLFFSSPICLAHYWESKCQNPHSKVTRFLVCGWVSAVIHIGIFLLLRYYTTEEQVHIVSVWKCFKSLFPNLLPVLLWGFYGRLISNHICHRITVVVTGDDVPDGRWSSQLPSCPYGGPSSILGQPMWDLWQTVAVGQVFL